MQQHLRCEPHVLLVVIGLRLQSWLRQCEMVMLHANRTTLSPADITLVTVISEAAPIYHIQ